MANVQFPHKLQFLFEQWPFKVAKGGRAGAKSWSFARALLLIGANPGILWPGRTDGPRIICARETQKSIAESVHQLLEDQIKLMRLDSLYRVEKAKIHGPRGCEFLFTGIRQASVDDIKSFEAADICWVEEAHIVSKRSWDILIPTIRKDGSEIWVSYNPELETDATHQRFVVHPQPEYIDGKPYCKVVTVNWSDNPWLSEKSRREKDLSKISAPDDYEHIWEGQTVQVVEGAIFRNELLAADKEQRITRVPYDPIAPVHTFWDLGFGDNTSIWFAQSIGFEYRLVDFLSASGQGLQWYVKQLQAKPYVYGTDWLPHDAQAHELGTGRTIEEQLRGFGRTVRIVPKVSIVDRIAAGRTVFPKCWFDADKCADGIQALRHYRYEINDKLGTANKDPLHDWASHPADAFTYFGVAVKEPAKPQPKREPQRKVFSAWS